MEAGRAVDGSGSAGDTLQLGNLGTLAQGVHDILGGQLSTQDIVGSDLAVDLNAVDGAVHGDDLHTLGHSGLNRAGDGIGVNGVDDQDGNALGNQVLNVGDLLGHIVAGICHGELHAVLGSGLFGPLNQGDEEGVILGGNGQTDGAVGCSGLCAGLTVDGDLTAGHGQNHGQAEKQCY